MKRTAAIPQWARRMLALGLLSLAASGCTTTTTEGTDMQARVDELMRDYSGDVPGASVLVLRDGAAVVRKSYGMADLEAHVAATPATD